MITHWQKSGQLSPISPPQKIYKNNKFYKFLPLKKMAFFFPTFCGGFPMNKTGGKNSWKGNSWSFPECRAKTGPGLPSAKTAGMSHGSRICFAPGRKWQVFSNGWFFDRLVFFWGQERKTGGEFDVRMCWIDPPRMQSWQMGLGWDY